MKVAVIGLGDIAAKAYLPVLSAVAGLDLHLVSRNPEALARLGDTYRLPSRHESLDGAIAAGCEAAFVHAATEAHPNIVTRLLEAGLHVYVDKPLADTLGEAERLAALAEARGRSLMVGFNRRFAPAYTALREAPRHLIVVEKNRHRLPAPPRRVVFDDFIHVADTLRFLVPGPIERTVIEARTAVGDVHQLLLTLSGEGFSATGMMSRMSGCDEEWLEAAGDGGKIRVDNVREVTLFRDGRRSTGASPDWQPATWLRGFDRHFLSSVTSGRRIDAADALETHRLCEAVTDAAEAQTRG